MSKISAVIFDLGGVILDIDQERTLKAFSSHGADINNLSKKSNVFNDYETGKIDDTTFRNLLKTELGKDLTDIAIDELWNAMLLTLPAQRLELINDIRKKQKIYLLSNTNSIHIKWFHQHLITNNLADKWQSLFEQIFLSYEIGLRKPDTACYQYVAEQIGCSPSQCLFIDDSIANIKGAQIAGMQTLHANEPLDIKMYQTIKESLN